MSFCEIKDKINFAHLLKISSFNQEVAQLCVNLNDELDVSKKFLDSSLQGIKENYHKALHLFKHNFQVALDSAEDEFMSGWSPQILSDLESYYADLLAGAKNEYDQAVCNLDNEISNLYKKLFSFSNNLNEKISINSRISELKKEKILKLQSYLDNKNRIDREFNKGRLQRAISISQGKKNRDRKTQLAKFFLDLQSRDIEKKRDESLAEVRKRFTFFKESVEQRFKGFMKDHPISVEV